MVSQAQRRRRVHVHVKHRCCCFNHEYAPRTHLAAGLHLPGASEKSLKTGQRRAIVLLCKPRVVLLRCPGLGRRIWLRQGSARIRAFSAYPYRIHMIATSRASGMRSCVIVRNHDRTRAPCCDPQRMWHRDGSQTAHLGSQTQVCASCAAGAARLHAPGRRHLTQDGAATPLWRPHVWR
jgi:hypothetical protein